MSIVKNTPIGLVLPFQNGMTSGYFDQSFDSFTQMRMNVINLLRTIPGERRMQPTLGCRLWNVVFEQNDAMLPERVTNIIKEDVSRWIPGVSIKNVTVKYYSDNETIDARDIYRIYIAVEFTIDAIQRDDIVEIYLDKGKI